MKVKLKYNMATYSGTMGEMTYCNYANGRVCVGRRWVMPRETTQNVEMRSVSANLAKIYRESSEGYRLDLKSYAAAHAKEKADPGKIPPGAYALYIKMMYAWAEADSEHVFLDAVTIADIESMEAPVSTIAEAVDAGLLPRTSNADLLIEEI